jgi:GH24 family phage-related lysozyme (muramidase)
MNTLIETIGEKVQKAIDEGDLETAEKLIGEADEWYAEYVANLTAPLEDAVFMAVYNVGYDNIDWSEIQMALENQFDLSRSPP